MELEHVDLGESWVLGIETESNRVCFLLDAVLTRDHPRFYWPPKPNEVNALARLRWCLAGEVHWNDGPNLDRPTVDPDGSSDYGQVDVFLASEDMRNFALEGDWGSVVVSNVEESVEYLDS